MKGGHNVHFYETLDPNVSYFVIVLRSNGFNTTCSSDDDMTIEVDIANLDEAEAIARLLQELSCEPFHIQARLFAPRDGFWVRRATIRLGDWRDIEHGPSPQALKQEPSQGEAPKDSE